MSAITSRATGPLTRRLPRSEPAGGWVIARVDNSAGFDEAILGGYSCDCNGRTLIQINRTMDVDARVQLGVTCREDGNRSYLPFRRMPWMVEEYMIARREWHCDICEGTIGTLQVLDGVIVGVEVACPLCMKKHRIDLTLGALPEELRFSAFGIEPPVPLLSPPAYDILRQMWACIQQQPSNSFTYQPYTVRHDSGQLRHTATARTIETALDHIDQLAAARLIDDGDDISISRSGVIVCLREFGDAAA